MRTATTSDARQRVLRHAARCAGALAVASGFVALLVMLAVEVGRAIGTEVFAAAPVEAAAGATER
ncbi:MAG TPA: hypothetical protein VNK91_10490 [Burkholderiaceae bacterium]|jgi:hypothetical protein|nr:hypothetical protein [Burkholderiaceae bacterium]